MASVTCARTSAPGRAQSACEPDDPVDLRRFTVGAADERAVVVDGVDEHVDLVAHEGVARGAGDRLLHRLALAQPLERELRVDRVGEVGRGRAVLGREREEPGPVELGRLEERQQLVVLALGLAGEADDERRPERRRRARTRGWRRCC